MCTATFGKNSTYAQTDLDAVVGYFEINIKNIFVMSSYLYTVSEKNGTSLFLPLTLRNADFQNSFTDKVSSKFLVTK